jgi:YggT family protein
VILVQLLDLYSFVVFAAVIVSWVQLPPTHPIMSVLGGLTEPLLGPIRRVLPDMGGLDLSPLVLLFGLRLVRGLLLSAALGGM